MNRRAIRPEDAVIIYLISLALYQVVGFILTATMNRQSDAYIFMAYAMPQVVYIVGVPVYMKITKVDFLPVVKKSNVKVIHYLFALTAALGVFFFALLPAEGIMKLFDLIGKRPTVTVPDLTKPVNIALAVIIMCILPAIGEELMFRKVFCDAFLPYGKVAAILLSGVIFGLGHLSLAQTFYQIFFGWVLAYIYVKTKNVTLTSLIHAVNNAFALFVTSVTGEEIWKDYTVLGIACAVGAVVLAGSLVYFALRTPKLKGKAIVADSDAVITAIYTEEGKVEIESEKEVERVKPSIFVIIFFALLTGMWVVSAIVL